MRLIDVDTMLDILKEAVDSEENESIKRLNGVFVQFIERVINHYVQITEQDLGYTEDIVRCKDCKHCFVDGDNVRYNVCDLNHNKVQSDDWFCADGERRKADAEEDV